MVVPSLERWVSSRVALIGDSAHAMSPHITAGASLGVEDVGVLRGKLSPDADLTTALKEYEADRLITRWTIVKAAPSDGYQGVYQVAQARAAQEQ